MGYDRFKQKKFRTPSQVVGELSEVYFRDVIFSLFGACQGAV
jgi:hypothetical protein